MAVFGQGVGGCAGRLGVDRVEPSLAFVRFGTLAQPCADRLDHLAGRAGDEAECFAYADVEGGVRRSVRQEAGKPPPGGGAGSLGIGAVRAHELGGEFVRDVGFDRCVGEANPGLESAGARFDHDRGGPAVRVQAGDRFVAESVEEDERRFAGGANLELVAAGVCPG